MDNNDPSLKDKLTFWITLAIGLAIIVIVLAIYITLIPSPPHL